MRRANLHSTLTRLFAQKRTNLAAIRALGSVVDDALFKADGDTAFHEKLIVLAESLPQGLRNLGSYGPLNSRLATVAHFLRGQRLISLVAETEGLFVDLIYEVVAAFPQKLGKSVPDVPTITQTLTRSDLIDQLAEAETNRVMYLKPAEYLTRLQELLSLPPRSLGKDWGTFVEAKARRDLALHNGWEWNRIYARKAGEAAAPSTVTLLYPNEDYFLRIAEAVERLRVTLESHVLRQFARCTRGCVFEEMWRRSPLQEVVDFGQAWTLESPEVVRPIRNFVWAWSGSERALFDFFMHIYAGDRVAVNFPEIYRKWSGDIIGFVDEWLQNPFHF